MERAEKDPRLGPMHVSLYLAILYCLLRQGGKRPARVTGVPAAIPKLCIKAGSAAGDMVLDPFAGTGTTLLQASILGR